MYILETEPIATSASERKHGRAAKLTPRWPQFPAL